RLPGNPLYSRTFSQAELLPQLAYSRRSRRNGNDDCPRDSQPDAGEEGRCIRKIVEKQIWVGRGQLFGQVPARGHGNDVGPDGPGASDVERRVADHPDALGNDRLPAVPVNFAQGRPGDFVAAKVMVAERAERKVAPQAVVAELKLGAPANVAGQQ